jgi:hypothetical protein
MKRRNAKLAVHKNSPSTGNVSKNPIFLKDVWFLIFSLMGKIGELGNISSVSMVLESLVEEFILQSFNIRPPSIPDGLLLKRYLFRNLKLVCSCDKIFPCHSKPEKRIKITHLVKSILNINDTSLLKKLKYRSKYSKSIPIIFYGVPLKRIRELRLSIEINPVNIRSLSCMEKNLAFALMSLFRINSRFPKIRSLIDLSTFLPILDNKMTKLSLEV